MQIVETYMWHSMQRSHQRCIPKLCSCNSKPQRSTSWREFLLVQMLKSCSTSPTRFSEESKKLRSSMSSQQLWLPPCKHCTQTQTLMQYLVTRALLKPRNLLHFQFKYWQSAQVNVQMLFGTSLCLIERETAVLSINYNTRGLAFFQNPFSVIKPQRHVGGSLTMF